jgi:hypothetical protein
MARPLDVTRRNGLSVICRDRGRHDNPQPGACPRSVTVTPAT